MIIAFTEEGWDDFEFWTENDKDVEAKIRDLIKEIKRTPFNGLGKPEPLRYNLKGFWSRRITGEHRLVYQVNGTKGKDQQCVILQCRFHYNK